MLVILSGCSGVGKNTIISNMIKNSDKYELLPTYTTREMRENERQGEPYYFIDDEEFKQRLEDGELYEHEIVHGHFYGTSKKLLNDKKKSGKILLKDIDVKGTQNLIALAQNDINILSFFLYVKTKDELVRRLVGRGEKNIDLRLSRYDMEMQYAAQYSYIIDNENMQNTIQIIESLIDFEKNKEIFLPTKEIGEINMDIVDEYVMLFRSKEKPELTPVLISKRNNKWYIIDGHHRYLASIMLGLNIPKEAIETKHVNEAEYYPWEALIQDLSKYLKS